MMCSPFVGPEQTGSPGDPLSWDGQDTQSGKRSLSSLGQLPDLLAGVIRVMQAVGYEFADIFAVRLALEEAVTNAIKHGHRHDPGKRARIWWAVSSNAVKLVVEDEGPDFDPSRVPDPRLPENLERLGGRGLFLIRAYMTWARYNSRGNLLAMCRRRSLSQSPPAS
jgi:serine/threonine-protein kinase RsbW